MVRVITQETYDEVVQENMEEFEMSPEEAVREAIAQFQAQGVDLSNIIKDLVLSTNDNHLVSMTVSAMKELIDRNYDDECMLQELEALKFECAKDLARRMRAAKDGAYNILIKLLEARLNLYIEKESGNNKLFVLDLLKTLSVFMDTQPDLLDDKGLELIKRALDTIVDRDILIATLKWTATCCVKHEMNRQKIFAKNIVENLKNLVETRKDPKLTSACMLVVRRLTLDDDIRVEFGKAHDHAKELAMKLLIPLTEMLNQSTESTDATECLDLLKTISPLLVRNELCALCAEHGACDALFEVMATHHGDAVLLLHALKLLTALAGNDDVKRQLVQAGIAPTMVSVMRMHTSNAQAAALALKAIAALTLREPVHSCLFFDSGAAPLVVDLMKLHPNDPSVQKNACWAIRNMVGRYREQNRAFHLLGVEELLNQAYGKFQKDFGFDIKAALRDLECDVKFDEPWRGTGAEIEN
ncbi:armadillo repeat-containing protein 6 homolog [Plodia interpunctella]|uniref:armadillo repeat-containing protein 6 homolog n=1 Tax=Plodia interpunctella TaxID=58824 RepID=UPI002367AB5B|nr:armadillo repeat-containing protein 6 homolog [Plodia interpunctella]